MIKQVESLKITNKNMSYDIFFSRDIMNCLMNLEYVMHYKYSEINYIMWMMNSGVPKIWDDSQV